MGRPKKSAAAETEVEAALRESEEKYRTLFETMAQGYVELQLIRDEAGRAVDWVYLATNKAAERLSGLGTNEELRGRKVSETYPNVGRWLETFDRISKSGLPERLEQTGTRGQWYEVYAYPRGSDRVIALYQDIDARKRAEAVLRQSEERQAFLLKLSDALRTQADPLELQAAAAALLRSHLDAARSYYTEIDDDAGVSYIRAESASADAPSGLGRYDLCDFEEVIDGLRRGTPLVCDDWEDVKLNEGTARELSSRNIRAQITIPLIKMGKLVGALGVNDTRPRRWTEQDIALVTETGERTWAAVERARAEEALRASERQLRATVDEREALLKELHHRVKNNLQVITSLLEMQARQVDEPSARSPLTEALNRVSAIATIHELLYQSGSLSRVDLVAYARRLVPHVVSLYEKAATIEVAVRGGEIMVDLARASPLGLLLNELVANACKHAFPPDTTGRLEVALHEEDGRMRLRVADTGVGIPAGFSPRESNTLGVQLVQMLAKQLNGTVEFHGRGGTTVDVHVPQ